MINSDAAPQDELGDILTTSFAEATLHVDSSPGVGEKAP
jgi:hypothetical protein